MKLSEAILLGSMIRPQARGLFDKGGSCAMGAALEANGVTYDESFPMLMINKLSEIAQPIRGAKLCPVCKGDMLTGLFVVEHLNDGHKWTRERIAAWVATIEPQDAPVVVEAVSEVGCVKA